MDQDIAKILETTFATCLANKELITENNKDLMLSVLYSAIGPDLEQLGENESLAKVEPTEQSVLSIYFNELDLSKFTKEDIGTAVEDIRGVLIMWENNRSTYYQG